MTKSLRNIFFAALFLYIFLAPFFFHPDLKTILYQSQFLSNGVTNIYRFLAENPDRAYLGPFVYPPLAYFIFGVLFAPIKFFAGGGFVDWLGMGNDAVSVAHIHRYLFVMKLPLIFVHFVTGVILTRLLQDKKKRGVLLLVWFFNPISLYVVSLMGQFDGIAVLATVLALMWAAKRPHWSALMLGIGGAIKSYPLLLLPFLAITAGKGLKQQLKIFVIGLIPYLLVITPFLKTQAFYQNTLVSGLSQRIFQAALPIGFDERIILFPGIFVVLVLFAFYRDSARPQQLFKYFLAVPLFILSFVHFHPQWAMWALPFVSLVLVGYKRLTSNRIWLAVVLFFLGAMGTVLLFDDKFLTWGLLGPIDPGVLFLPTPVSLIARFFDPLLLQSLAHTLMSAAAVWIVWQVFSEKNNA